MKKIFILAALGLGISAGANAQQKVVGEEITGFVGHEMNETRVPTDTLSPGTATGWVLNTAVTGGYVTGNNGYGDLSKAQYFLVQDAYNIEGAIFWFGGKEVGGDGTVDLNIYAMDGTANTSNSPTDFGPGTILVSESENMSNIDTSSTLADAHIHMFSAPYTVQSDYAVGFSVANLTPGDTIGMVNSADGDDMGFNSSYEEWSDGSWYSMYSPDSWGLDIFFGIFPIVDLSVVGIEEQSFINGVKMEAYPNPASDRVTIAYELQNSATDVEILVYNTNGQVVNRQTVVNNGLSNEVELDVTNLTSGVYYYTVMVGGASESLTSKFIVE